MGAGDLPFDRAPPSALAATPPLRRTA